MNVKFERVLSSLITAICAAVFFLGFTVIGFVMRLFPKSCRMNMNKSAASYWRNTRAARKDA